MNNAEITLRFSLDARQALSATSQLAEGFRRVQAELAQGATGVQTSIGGSDRAVRTLNASVETLHRSTEQMDASSKAASASTTQLAVHAAAAFGALRALRGMLEEVMDTTMALDKAQRTLQYATGDGAAAMAFVRRTCQELGLELISTAQSYAKFAAGNLWINAVSIRAEAVRLRRPNRIFLPRHHARVSIRAEAVRLRRPSPTTPRKSSSVFQSAPKR